MTFYNVARFIVFVALAGATAVAVGAWAVRTRRLNPFSRLGQTVRRLTDPVLAPMETFLARRGGNPQNAAWWVLGIVIVGGIILLSGVQWIATTAIQTTHAVAEGPRGIAFVLVVWTSKLLVLAILVRVFGSWFGKGRFTPWMRPFYLLTDWMIVPLRRFVPQFGMFDVTPLVAWVLIIVIRNLILGAL
jgi:YggT family protein